MLAESKTIYAIKESLSKSIDSESEVEKMILKIIDDIDKSI